MAVRKQTRRIGHDENRHRKLVGDPENLAGRGLLRQVVERHLQSEHAPHPGTSHVDQSADMLRVERPGDAEKDPPAALGKSLSEQFAPAKVGLANPFTRRWQVKVDTWAS